VQGSSQVRYGPLPDSCTAANSSRFDHFIRDGEQRGHHGFRENCQACSAHAWSVAPGDVYSVISAATARNRYGLIGTARRIGTIRRYDVRRISMRPIPGNIICVCVVDVGRRLRRILQRRPPVCFIPSICKCWPESTDIVSVAMPERSRGKWMRSGANNRRGRSNCASISRPRFGGRCVHRKHKRYCAKRRDNCPIRCGRHNIDHSLVALDQKPPKRTLGSTADDGKPIVGRWLRRIVNAEPPRWSSSSNEVQSSVRRGQPSIKRRTTQAERYAPAFLPSADVAEGLPTATPVFFRCFKGELLQMNRHSADGR
jgi:hypothetical protein